MVGIPVGKYCCGNCELYDGGVCLHDCLPVLTSRTACNLIHKNFIDRGYGWTKPKDTSLRSKDAKS